MISIVSPCYNVELYLPRYIDSILAQTSSDWELILIDDGSTDRSGEICDDYAARDARIQAIHKQNNGVSEARNAGIEISKGEYIVFFDTDDWTEPEMLHILHDACIRTGCDLAACDAYYVSQNEQGQMVRKADYKWGNLQKEKIVTEEEMYYSVFLKSATLWNKMFLRDAIKDVRFDTEKHYGEDVDFLLKALQQIRSAVLLPYVGYNYYNKRPGNVVSAGIDKRSLELVENAKKLYSGMKGLGLNALGVYRIHTAVMEVLRKIPVEALGKKEMKKYINACGKAIRYPSLKDRFMFFADRHFNVEAKSRYFMNMISPGFRTAWKRVKYSLLGR